MDQVKERAKCRQLKDLVSEPEGSGCRSVQLRRPVEIATIAESNASTPACCGNLSRVSSRDNAAFRHKNENWIYFQDT